MLGLRRGYVPGVGESGFLGSPDALGVNGARVGPCEQGFRGLRFRSEVARSGRATRRRPSCRLLGVEAQRLAEEDDVRVTTAFRRLLRLPGASVIDVSFGAEGVIVTVRLRRRRRVCSVCGQTGRRLEIHDHRVKRWRHLDLGGSRCVIEMPGAESLSGKPRRSRAIAFAFPPARSGRALRRTRSPAPPAPDLCLRSLAVAGSGSQGSGLPSYQRRQWCADRWSSPAPMVGPGCARRAQPGSRRNVGTTWED